MKIRSDIFVPRIKHFRVSTFFNCDAKSGSVKLEVGEHSGLIPRVPAIPLRSRWSASPGHHPQAQARGH